MNIQRYFGMWVLNCLLCMPAQAFLTWDWSTVGCEDENFLYTLKFPKNFVWGIGDSDFQTAGIQTEGEVPVENNWTRWQGVLKDDGTPYIKDNQVIGNAAGRWDRWQEDIDQIKACGFGAYRCSIDWSKVEPEEGAFNEAVLDHYVEQCRYAQEQGIDIWVALWHYTWPAWFDDIQAFEREENNHYFVRYCTKVVEKLAPHVKTWLTFNQPEGYAWVAYVGFNWTGYPPAKKDWQLGGTVLKNMFDCHIQVYEEIKKIDPAARVGFAKSSALCDPYRPDNQNDIDSANFLNSLLADAVFDLFKTGVFRWYIPERNVDITYTNPKAVEALDFIGINYYSHSRFKKDEADAPAIAITDPGVPVSDQGRIIYPEGLYRVIMRANEIGKPVFVTENGIADGQDRYRDMYIKKHLYAVTKALEDGADVRGYFYWSLGDNFEWLSGYTQFYGLYKIDFTDPLLPRTLRNSARNFVEFVQSQR